MFLVTLREYEHCPTKYYLLRICDWATLEPSPPQSDIPVSGLSNYTNTLVCIYESGKSMMLDVGFLPNQNRLAVPFYISALTGILKNCWFNSLHVQLNSHSARNYAFRLRNCSSHLLFIIYFGHFIPIYPLVSLLWISLLLYT